MQTENAYIQCLENICQQGINQQDAKILINLIVEEKNDLY